MSQELYLSLKNKVTQSIYLYEINNLLGQIDSLFASQKLSQPEYGSLSNLAKKQLKATLDLNLLPNYEYIAQTLLEKCDHSLIKIDSGEILVEEFEIIEQEVRNLNQARVKYIQDNFLEKLG